MTSSEHVTIAVTNYNGGEKLVETLDSFKKLSYSSFSIMVIDNCSTDNSITLVQEKHPDVKIIKMPSNMGPSAARNRALKESISDLIFLSDNDITAAPNTLAVLVDELRKNPDAATSSARILYSDEKTIQSDGVIVHYLAMSMPRNRRMLADSITDTNSHINVCANGGIMLVDKTKALSVGGFDEDYFFGWDDLEFSYRTTLAGYVSISVPKAVIIHKDKNWGTKRSYYQLRNRWYFILINYSWKTIFLISPMLITYEFAMMAFMLVKRVPLTYLRAMKDVIANLKMLMKKRYITQSMRKRKDTEMLTIGEIYIERGLITKSWITAIAQVVNDFFNIYWKLVRRII